MSNAGLPAVLVGSFVDSSLCLVLAGTDSNHDISESRQVRSSGSFALDASSSSHCVYLFGLGTSMRPVFPLVIVGSHFG